MATDAPLLPHQLERVVKRAALGLGRQGSTAGNGSGDIFVAFSTANPRAAGDSTPTVALRMVPNERLDPIFAATVQATEEAITNAMLADTQPETPDLQQLAQESAPDPMAVARAVPGFGGLFLDSSGMPAVYLTDLGQRGAAEQALTGFTRREGSSAPPLKVLKGDFDYLTLDRWLNRATPEALAVPGTVFIDLDEAGNRVRIGIEDRTAEVAVKHVIARLGIPASAVIVERTAPIRLAATLRSRVRPVRGGLQINFTQFICTLGFNAVKNGVNSFITNSHCTKTQGGNQGTVYHQPLSSTANSSIGTEVADPNYFQGGVCPAGRRCRYSDAARARYNSGVSFNLAQIARTTSRRALSGPLTISTANPFLSITAERANPVAGAQANKIGRTTGWTFGQISATCAAVNVPGPASPSFARAS